MTLPSAGKANYTAAMRAAVILLLLSVSGCKPAAKTEAPPPPPEVTTHVTAAQDVGLSYVYAGRITAFRQVEVRARVGGILEQRSYVEGTRVKAGDLLFRIDRAPYEAALARSAGQLRQQVAQQEKAGRDLKRANTLLVTQAGTIQARDDALSAVALADAAVASAEADVRTQALNLGYTSVTAPLSGVTSLEAVPEGSLVGTTVDNSLLTRITQTDPVYVTFSFDNDDLSQIRGLAGREVLLSAEVTSEGQTRTGLVDFTDSSVDQATGTVRGRALFANADALLVPGQFVRVTLGGVVMHGALSVPKLAVDQDAAGAFVFVVEGGRARRAAVALGPSAGDNWVVDGLHAGDAVIVGGLVHVHEGGTVHVVDGKPGA